MDGLTNNTVKFLVKLDIDHREAKRDINNLLKEYRNHNINVTASTKAFKNQLDGVLKKYTEGDFKIAFALDTKKSKSVTDLMNNLSSVKSNVVFNIDKESSRKVTEKIQSLRSTPVEIDIKFKNGMLNESKSGNLGNVALVGKLNVKETKRVIAEQIKKMKLPEFTVGVSAKVSPVIKNKDVPNLIGESKSTTVKKQNAVQDNLYVGKKAEVIKQVTKEYEKLNQVVTLFSGSAAKGEHDFIEALKKQGRQVEILRDQQTGAIKKVTSVHRNSAGEMETTYFRPLSIKYDSLTSKIKNGSKQVQGFVADVSKIKNVEKFDLDKGVDKLSKKLDEAKHKLNLTDEAFKSLAVSLSRVSDRDGLEKLNKQTDEAITKQKRLNELESKQNAVIKQRNQLEQEIVRISKMYPQTASKFKDNTNISKLDDRLLTGMALKNSVGKFDNNDIKSAQALLASVRNEIKKINVEAMTASQNAKGIIDQLKVAFTRFPVWMLASTAFYQTTNAIKSMGQTILDVDTKMTNLKKVMSDDTDFDKVFTDATESATKFGQTLTDVLDSYGEFARQGFGGDELQELSEAALVTANVAELTAGESSQFITSALIQWKKDTKEAMGLIDNWNNLSNKFPVSTLQLAEAGAKAASVAEGMQIEFEEFNAMAGVIAAATRQSGSEIGNSLKAILPRLLTKQGQDALAMVGVSSEDADGNLRNVVEIYKDVAKSMQSLTIAEQNAVVFGLGGTYHRTRLQVLLDDLSQVESTYDDMYQAGMDSEGSAMRENATYMESLQARINLLKVEFQKLAVSVGEAFATEGMITALSTMRQLISGVASLTQSIGTIPVILMSAAAAAALFSSNFRKGISSIPGSVVGLKDKLKSSRSDTGTESNVSDATRRETIVIDGNTEAVNKNDKAKTGLLKTIRGLALGFAPLGIALGIAGFAFEKIAQKVTEARKAKEEFQQQQEQELEMFTNNKEEITKLADKYSELSSKQSEQDLNTEEYSELVRIQNELGLLLPNAIQSETEFGDKVLQSSSQIQTKIQMLEDELAIQEKLNEERKKGEREDATDNAKNLISDGKSSQENSLAEAYNFIHKMEAVGNSYKELRGQITEGVDVDSSLFGGNTLKNIEDVEVALKNVNSALANKDTYKLTDGTINELESTKSGLQSIYQDLLSSQKDMMSGMNTLKTNYTEDLTEMLNSTKGFSKDGKDLFSDVIISVANMSETEEDLEKLNESISSLLMSKDKGVIDDFDELSSVFNIAKSTTAEDFAEITKNAEKMKESLKKSLSASGLSDAQIKSIMEILNKSLATQSNKFEEASKHAKKHGVSLEEAAIYVSQFSSETESATGTVDEFAESLLKLNSVEEEIANISRNRIESSEQLLAQYELLTLQIGAVTDEEIKNLQKKEQLNSSEQALISAYNRRSLTMTNLQKVYPGVLKLEKDAISLSSEQINAMKAEEEATKILLEATKLYAEGKLSSEQAATLATALNTRDRISNIMSEIEALEALNDSLSDYIDNAEASGNEDASRAAIRAAMIQSNNNKAIKSKTERLKALQDELKTGTGTIQNYTAKVNDNTKSTEKSTEATKDAIKEQTALEKITGKYALTQQKLNNALKEVQAKLEKYPKHSKEYRAALREEIDLIQNQIDLNNQKAKELATVPQTVTQTTTQTSQQVVTGTVKPAGWNGTVTSQYGVERSDGKHRGIDIDGAIGDRLDANVNGKVLKAGKASDIGEHWTYGNLVIIQDENNNKHYYAHMNDISVVSGQQISAGTKIGSIGNSGNTSKGKGGDGSHLHYEIRGANGGLVNPNSYVSAAKTGVQAKATSTAYASNTTNNTTQGQVWAYFKQKGLSDNAIAGIMGNINQESKFNPGAVNETSKASGLFQWLGTRKTELMAYAKSVGTSWQDVQTQLDFAWKELMSTEKSSFNSLQRGDSLSASDHAAEFDRLFERSGKSGVANRRNYANQYLNEFAGMTMEQASSTSTTMVANGDYATALQQIEDINASNKASENEKQKKLYEIVNSQIADYENNRNIENNAIEQQSKLQEGMLKTSRQYEDSLNKQYNSENRKLKSMKDEYDYIEKQIKSGTLNAAQIDELRNKQRELNIEAQESANQMKEYYGSIVNVNLANYDKQMESRDAEIAKQEALKEGVLQYSKAYEQSVNKQYNAENAKLKLIKQEYNYIQQQLKSGKLTADMYEELTARAAELNVEAQQALDLSKAYRSEVIGSRLARFDNKQGDLASTIAFEDAKLKSVDRSSDRYNKTLQKLATTKKSQISTMVEEQKYVDKMLKSGNLTIEMYEELKNRSENLRVSMVGLNEELHQYNYEMVLTRSIISDGNIEDIDFNLKKSESLFSAYEDGDANQLVELTYQLGELQNKLAEVEEKGKNLQLDIRGKDLGHAELESLEKQLQDNALAYLDVRNSIIKTEKSIEDFNKQAEESVEKLRKDLGEELIDALKDMYEELRDIQIDAIDDLIDAEEKRHDKVMKQYDDEMKAYNKIIDAKMREIDDADRDRTHQNTLNDLYKERSEIQAKANLLSGSNVYADKKEREGLLKQIADIDKRITEENYQYSKDAQKQSLQDQLDEKTEQVEKLKEEEQKLTDDTKDELEKKKEYWDKYYEDILNNERKFERLRNDMAKGNFAEIEGIFNKHSRTISDTLSSMGVEVDGTFKKIGYQIRANVINEMDELIKKIKEVEEETAKLQQKSSVATNEYGSSIDKAANTNIGNDGELSDADKKVLMAKFLKEEIMHKLDPEKDKSRIKNISDKANALAAEGRAEGATVDANLGLNEILDTMNQEQKSSVGKYFYNSYDEAGLVTDSYNKYIQDFGVGLANGQVLGRGDKQVLMAKYLKEKLAPAAKTTAEKESLSATANKIAQAGRANGSTISSSTVYDDAIRNFSSLQRGEFGDWLLSNSSIISQGYLRSEMEEYGNRLRVSYKDYLGLDIGGMTGNWSGAGADGKGGKSVLLHPNEIVNNPLDSERLLKTASVMDSIMSTIGRFVGSPRINKPNLGNATTIDESVKIDINVAQMNANSKSDLDSLGKQVVSKLRRERGK